MNFEQKLLSKLINKEFTLLESMKDETSLAKINCKRNAKKGFLINK